MKTKAMATKRDIVLIISSKYKYKSTRNRAYNPLMIKDYRSRIILNDSIDA